MTSTRLISLALLGLAALPLHASNSPRFLAGDAVFPVTGDLPGVVLQPLSGAGGLDFPTSLTHANDARIFLTIRDGRIVIFQNGAVLGTPFLDIRNLVGTQGEGGLLSVAFHPRFAENGFLFVNYTDPGVAHTVIARYQVSAGDPNRADPASGRVLLRIDQPFSNHNGGQIAFGPDGFLYIGMGDGGAANDPGCRAQRDDGLLGKMLRIDVDQSVNQAPFYGIPADNPFRGNDGVPDEVWARGLRNPWRFAFDRETGDLWIGDVGQGTREEIDRQAAGSPGGENYGWKVMEGTLCFSRDACPASTPACNSPALTLPVLEYQNGSGGHCAVIGGTVYRGSRVPQLRGTYLFGDLCSGSIWGAKQQGGSWEVRRLAGAESAIGNQSLIAFGEDRDGEVYVLTGSSVFRIDTGQGGNQGGDGVGLFQPSTVTFRLKRSPTAGPADQTFRFGKRGKGWIAVAGDWNGDGRDGIGFWDPGTRSFRLKNTPGPGTADLRVNLKQIGSGMVPLIGDWDGDGKAGVGFYDPGSSTFRIKNPLKPGGFGRSFRFGSPGAGQVPLAGDWDGDGKDSIGVYDPDTDTFLLRNSLDAGDADVRYDFDVDDGVIPVVGDWDGDGVDTPGFYRTGSGEFALTGKSGTAIETVFEFGEPGGNWLPLIGTW
ncbi:MAG: PQQ-dependent sugar dehydrogenase [Acidobacteriota bacterium]